MHLHINTDGACKGNPGEMGIGIVFKDDNNNILEEFSQNLGEGTNNVAELTAIKIALERAVELKANMINLFSDSEWCVKVLNGQYKAKKTHLITILDEIKTVLPSFEMVKFHWVPRLENARADALANAACGIR